MKSDEIRNASLLPCLCHLNRPGIARDGNSTRGIAEGSGGTDSILAGRNPRRHGKDESGAVEQAARCAIGGNG